MKKIIIISTTLLLLTGCGNTIICKTTGGKIIEEYNIKYNKNEITNLTTKKTYKLDTKEQFKNFESIIQYTVKANTSENITAKYKKKNKKYILIQDYNINKMSEEESIKLGVSKNKEELVNRLKNNGLTCK